MTDENPTTDTETHGDLSDPAKKPSQTQNELPDWARQKITDANQEAANRRVQLRAAEQTIESLQEQVSTLTTERDSLTSNATTVQTDFDKLVTAVQTLFPEKQSQVFTFAKTLQGDTAEDLANHAADLNRMFGISAGPSPAVDRSQGLGTGAVSNSPADEFAALLNQNLRKG